MKAPSKLHNKSQHLAKVGGLALAVILLGILPVTAQKAPIPATTTQPNATAKPATAATTKAATTPATPDTDTSSSDLTNWVTLGVGSAFVSGDKGNYSHQKDTNSGPYGGVDDFHWQQFLGKEVTLTVDGHAIFGNHDYDLKLDLTDEKLGYIRGGYTEFRTWYDNNGGYFPKNGKSYVPYASDLYVDRRFAWVEAGLTLPDWPILTFRYDYDSRQGQMDSSMWGQSSQTGLPTSRGFAPTFLGVDETRNIFQLGVKDKIDDTDSELGFRYEVDRTNDATYVDAEPTTASSYITQDQLEQDSIFNAHGSTVTEFDKMVTYSTGFAVSSISTDLAGSRIFGPNFNTPYNPADGGNFLGLTGGGNTKDYIGNMNLMLTPCPNLVIVPAARVEYEGSHLSDNETAVGRTAPFTLTPTTNSENNWEMEVAQSLEARYTGFPDWSLYASGELSENWGNELWNTINNLTHVQTPYLNQNWSEFEQKYTAGANWYPLAQLNFGGQYYHQIHAYDYNNTIAGYSPIQYPGYLQRETLTTDDMNFRCTWQALNNLSLITRYDFQLSTVDTKSNAALSSTLVGPVGTIQSSVYTNHILSENVSWTPLACLNLQVGGSYTMNSLDLGVVPINNIVTNGNNNYWTLDASACYEFDAKTHLQLQYDYYNADDFVNNAAYSMPYGASAQENSVTATITREISKAVDVSVKYGFYRYRDQTDGGLDNYDAQLVYVTTKFKF